MMASKPFRVLFDSSLWNEAVTHEYYFVPKETQWGDTKVQISNYAKLQERILRRKTAEESKEIFLAMRLIAQLSESGTVQLHDTIELMFEWMGRAGGPSMRGTEFDPFKKVKIVRLKPPVERGVVFSGLDLEDNFKNQKDLRLEGIQDPRFNELKRVINRVHWADAFHLWTAEFYGLDCVLTLEKKVRKILANQRTSARMAILDPFELAERFCIGYRLRNRLRSMVGKLTGRGN
jgi:hypothetical protein